jgi:hypothetical protein
METPLTKRKPIKTVEQIKASEAFAALNSANQKEFVLMLAGGATPMAAIGSVYHFKAKETARQFLYATLRKPPMKNVLRELYGETDKADFLRDLDRASQNKKITRAQVQSLLLIGIAKGFLPSNTSLLSDENDDD